MRPPDRRGPDARPAEGLSGVSAAIAELTRDFLQAEIPSPALDARLLVAAACGLTHEDLIREPGRPLDAAERERIATWRERRLAREPVSRILGRRAFWRHEFLVTPATLDPRPDSETVVESALALARQEHWTDRPLRVLDLGTGTGCLLLSVLAEIDTAVGLGVDADPDAALCAAANARRLGLADRAGFVCTDWCSGLAGQFDLILSNPPYISHSDIQDLAPEVAAHDPRAALDGGSDGLEAYRAMLPATAGLLAPGGWLIVEIGVGQEDAVIALMRSAGLAAAPGGLLSVRDLTGRVRVVAAGVSSASSA